MIIGGTDSSGGAGLTRDTATACQLGVAVLPVVTAVTAQTDKTVTDVAMMSPSVVAAQISAALQTGGVACIKIGMLGTQEIAEAVADALADSTIPVVLDPVFMSSSGKKLLTGNLPVSLLKRADLITPNLLEAAALSGQDQAQTDAQIIMQSSILRSNGSRAVLVKGGHGHGGAAVDHLFVSKAHHRFRAQRLIRGRRGTGCTLATAIACYIGQKESVKVACRRAKAFVHEWLLEGVRDLAQ
jgi:hydroxymethylpyrimidine/phosphomethylpyrimidine kinase